MRINWSRVMWLLTAFLVALGILMAISPKAKADMCGPTPGLPSYSYPWVKSCRLYVPFTGGMIPAVPVIQPPNGIYPIPGIGGTGGIAAPGYQPGSGYTPIPWP